MQKLLQVHVHVLLASIKCKLNSHLRLTSTITTWGIHHLLYMWTIAAAHTCRLSKLVTLSTQQLLLHYYFINNLPIIITIIYYSHYDLLARVIHVFGIFQCLWEAIGGFYIGNSSYLVFLFEFICLELWLYGCVHIVINIGKFSEKSSITNINSPPIHCKLSCTVLLHYYWYYNKLQVHFYYQVVIVLVSL